MQLGMGQDSQQRQLHQASRVLRELGVRFDAPAAICAVIGACRLEARAAPTGYELYMTRYLRGRLMSALGKC